MRLSVAAWRLADTTETRSALLAGTGQKEQSVFTVPDTDSEAAERQLTADGRTLVSVTADQIRMWDMRTRRPTHTYPGPGALLGDDAVVISPDGQRLAVLGLWLRRR